MNRWWQTEVLQADLRLTFGNKPPLVGSMFFETKSELTPFRQVTQQGETYWNARQTFAADQGDTPDDWYEFYVDPKTFLVRQMGYIVTYGRSRKEAEKNVSVIVYDDYTEMNGIMMAQRWSFGSFSLKDGFQSKKGEGRLSNMRFISSRRDLFAVPQDTRELPKPQ